MISLANRNAIGAGRYEVELTKRSNPSPTAGESAGIVFDGLTQLADRDRRVMLAGDRNGLT